MEAILTEQCLSLTGVLGRGYGYYLQRRGKRFFAVRMRLNVPPDGHWRFIVLCAELAQNKLYIADIEVDWMELSDALYEASHFETYRLIRYKGVKGVKTTYNAADIINTLGL